MNEENILGLDQIEVENTPIDNIESEVVNLIFVGIDCSGSMHKFVPDMKKSLLDFKTALKESKEVDELLISRANFYDDIVNIEGYKPVGQFNVDYNPDGMTPLYQAICEGSEKLLTYMDYLKQQ